MSLYPIIWAAEHAPVYDAEERAILVALVMKGDFDGCNCFRSYKTLAQAARVDAKTAGRKCRAMEARGILRRQTEHLSKAWLAIPEKQRPVVWEVMIPAEWWSPAQLDDLNEQRASLGRPPITPRTRPVLAAAPPKKTRADKGVKRPKGDAHPEGVGTTSPQGDPGTTSPHPRDYKSPPQGLQVPTPGTTSPTTIRDTIGDTPRDTTHSPAAVDTLPAAGASAPEVSEETGSRTLPLFGDDAPGPGRRKPKTKNGTPDGPDGFDAFWEAYPRKVGKGAARKAYAAAVRRGAAPQALLDAVRAHAATWERRRTEARYIPHPTTWLNQERYEDDLDNAAPSASGGGYQPWQCPPAEDYHAGWSAWSQAPTG